MVRVKNTATKLTSTGGKPLPKQFLVSRAESKKIEASKNKPKSGAGDRKGKNKKRKWKPGELALKEIRRYQKSTDLIIQRRPFQRLVCEIFHQYKHRFGAEPRIQFGALLALQEMSEAFLVDVFSNANLCAIHARRVTINPSDMQLTMKIKDDNIMPTDKKKA